MAVEAKLRSNPQYAYARDMEQMGALALTFVANPLDNYTKRIMTRGVRMGDVKIPALRPEPDWLPVLRGSSL